MGGIISSERKLKYSVQYFPNPESQSESLELPELPDPSSPDEQLCSVSPRDYSVIVPYTKQRFFVFSSAGFAQLYEYKDSSREPVLLQKAIPCPKFHHLAYKYWDQHDKTNPGIIFGEEYLD